MTRRMTGRMRALAPTIGGMALMVLAGCATLAPPDPTPADVLSEDTSASMKIRAIRASWTFVDEGRIEHGPMRELLKRTVWKRSLFWEVRTVAVVALLEDEANLEDTKSMMHFMLPTETHWQMIELICETAGERGWTELSTSIVRSWSRPVPEPPDDQRPERRALERLYPDRLAEDVVFDVFAGRIQSPAGELRDRDRKDAWELLTRLDPKGGRARDLLRQVAPEEQHDPLFADLYAGARDLGVVPRTREQLDWLVRLRAPEFEATWNQAASLIASLGEADREGFGLRHVQVLLWVSEHRPEWLELDREAMIDRIQAYQREVRNYARDDLLVMIGAGGESIRSHGDEVGWCDALVAFVAVEVARDQSLPKALFAHADRDKRDTSTELGGLIRSGSTSFIAEPRDPRPAQRRGDQRFVASPEMIDASTVALFHYHFHATRYTSSEYAGPSRGDLGYADRFGAACLVFTFVSRDLLNVDLYLPGSVVLDLGVIRRPGE